MATEEEIINSLKTDWKATDYYNFNDLDRVENATIIVKDKVESLRSKTITLSGTKTDRTNKSIEFADSLNRIEGNINTLMQELDNAKDLKEAKLNWSYNKSFSFNDANRYENNLLIMYNYAKRNLEAVPYCGEYTLTTEKGVL